MWFLAKIISFYLENCKFSAKNDQFESKIANLSHKQLIFYLKNGHFRKRMKNSLEISGQNFQKIYHLDIDFRRFRAKFGRVENSKKSGNFKISPLRIWYKLL